MMFLIILLLLNFKTPATGKVSSDVTLRLKVVRRALFGSAKRMLL